mmetsp:Transcript_22710/g.63165  ORF Transcript_22710/g.63165 Transcript_22710/m.63165 type:complete len:111 (+) Transcript_22710:220-552(+)
MVRKVASPSGAGRKRTGEEPARRGCRTRKEAPSRDLGRDRRRDLGCRFGKPRQVPPQSLKRKEEQLVLTTNGNAMRACVVLQRGRAADLSIPPRSLKSGDTTQSVCPPGW